MGWFSGKKQSRHNQDASAVELMVAALAELGVQATIINDFVVHDSLGRVYGANNVSRMMQNHAPEDRLEVVTGWMRVILESKDKPKYVFEDVRDITYLRIHSKDFGDPNVNELVEYNGFHLAQDLVVLPAVDLPDIVETSYNVSTFGSWDEIWPVGLAHLSALPLPDHEVLGEGDPDEPEIHAFIGDDFFVASRLLVIEDLLRAVGVDVNSAHRGMLVSMPSRHVLFVHLIRDTSIVLAMKRMLNLGVVHHENDPGPLSEHLFYRSPTGQLEYLTQYVDGNLCVVLDEQEFVDVWNELNDEE